MSLVISVDSFICSEFFLVCFYFALYRQATSTAYIHSCESADQILRVGSALPDCTFGLTPVFTCAYYRHTLVSVDCVTNVLFQILLEAFLILVLVQLWVAKGWKVSEKFQESF